ncbi:DnaJ-class molecular chaperone [Streptomyces canus]|uniref:hypothetical protein n=1 Tax=Streptomyces canus TaxID=58343 RepID=UPI00278A86C3|nr:hypothetical protein [Streptomyces canus]MDQ0600568.1 DnaJ-class molecular chaperone [Streptomyces canus]
MTGPNPAPQSLTRVCPNCHGFASAAVTSGLGRDHHGHLPTITVDCPACHGHGTIPTRAVQFAGGRA